MILIRPDGVLEEHEDDVALGLIKTGGFALDLDQRSPPFAIIELLNGLAGDITPLGSPRVTPEMLAKVQENLFKGQIKQNLVLGRAVSWRPYAKLQQTLHNRLFHTVSATKNLYSIVEAVWLRRLDQIDQIETRHMPISEEEQLESGLAQARKGRVGKAYNPNAWIPAPLDQGEPWQYKAVGPEWVRFYFQLRKVLEIVEETKRLACEQACILVSESHNGIERLVEPERAFAVLQRRTRKPEFIFSADLPPIFSDHREVGALIGNARSWMERVSKALEPKGKFARKVDMITVVIERSAITETSARKAYETAKVRNKGSKRLPSEAYISIESLRHLFP